MKATLIRRTFCIKPLDLVYAAAVMILITAFFSPALFPASVISWGAAVTIVARSQRYNVMGARWAYEYSLTGADTNTLDTPIATGKRAKPLMEPCTVTAIAQSAVNGKIRLTFSATGAFTAKGLIIFVG